MVYNGCIDLWRWRDGETKQKNNQHDSPGCFSVALSRLTPPGDSK